MRITGFGLLILIVQIYFGIHAYRKGKFFWIFLILFFPVVGVAIYFFVEYLPTMRVERGLQRAGTQVVNTLNPSRRLEMLEEQLAEFDTIVTRQDYAKELALLNRDEEAIEVLEEGLRGAFVNDAQTLFQLAQLYAKKQDAVKAQGLLETIQQEDAGFYPEDVRLLRARMLEAQGQLDDALIEYEALAQRGLSEEPRFYLALALDKQGNHEAANEVFEQAQKYMQRSSGIYRRENQTWHKQMKQYFSDKAKAPDNPVS